MLLGPKNETQAPLRTGHCHDKSRPVVPWNHLAFASQAHSPLQSDYDSDDSGALLARRQGEHALHTTNKTGPFKYPNSLNKALQRLQLHRGICGGASCHRSQLGGAAGYEVHPMAQPAGQLSVHKFKATGWSHVSTCSAPLGSFCGVSNRRGVQGKSRS